MGGNDGLSSLTGRGEEARRAASEAARDVDWMKVRRVQNGIGRPDATDASSVSREELVAEARTRRAMRLAYALAFVAGVLLGLMFLRGPAEDLLLLAASLCFACAGLVTASRVHS